MGNGTQNKARERRMTAKKTKPQEASWKLAGYDTFSNEEYALDGTYPTEAAAKEAAKARLAHLERTQPKAHSGGQSEDGLQDRVFIVAPSGSSYQYVPVGNFDRETLAREEKRRAIPRTGFRVVAMDPAKAPGAMLVVVGDFTTREEAEAVLAQKEREKPDGRFYIYTPDTQ